MRSPVRAVMATALLWCCASAILIASAASPFSFPVSTVIIDAGHGGSDPGAVATWRWDEEVYLQEKDITLDLARRVAARLASEGGLDVVLTRDDDRFILLPDRAKVASHLNPGVNGSSLFVSIHVNSSPSQDPSGFEILVKQTDKRVRFLDASSADWMMLRYANHTSGELNRLLNRENILLAAYLRQALGARFPAMRDRGVKEQDVWVLNASAIPSALVEVAFISNPDDALDMNRESWRDAMALAIAEGILGYVNRD